MQVRKMTLGWIALGLIGCTILVPWKAAAGVFELSAGFNYNRRNYAEGSFTLLRRYGGSFGYRFTERSGIEFGFQDAVDHTLIEGYQDLTTHDRVYSISWVQELLGKESAFQPYFKVGVGQLNRDTSGAYANGASPALVVDSLTGVLGAGARIMITRTFAIRSEVTTYLTGGAISTWKDDVAFSIGFSFIF